MGSTIYLERREENAGEEKEFVADKLRHS